MALTVLATLLVGLASTVPAHAATWSVDEFVSTYSGKSLDFDGAYGAQCTDLFNYYHRDVVNGSSYVRMGSSGGAKDLWEATPAQVNALYDKIPAGSPARKGDVAVWGGSKPNGTAGVCGNSSSGRGCGHVSIVLADLGNGTLRTFTQNPGAAHQYDDSKQHLLGYLRPKRFADTGNPFGSPFDSADSPANGKLHVRGWAVDPDARTAPLQVHVYVGGPAGSGAPGTAVTADQSRPDVGRAVAGAGDNHGFETTIDVGRGGDIPVYVYAINAGGTPGDNTLLGNTVVKVGDPRPVGSFDGVASSSPGYIRVTGWAFDPDARTTALRIHAYVGAPAGRPNAEFHDLGIARVSRPDVAKAHPGVGSEHGFDRTIATNRNGDVPVYVYAINAPGTSGDNPEIGSRTVRVRNPDPFGSFDSAVTPYGGRIDVSGWAIDPNTPTKATEVHVYVGGAPGTPGAEFHRVPAGALRKDVGKAYPGTGQKHGFAASLSTRIRGATTVYVYAINRGPGQHVLLAQRSVVVSDPLPITNNRRPSVTGAAKRTKKLKAKVGAWTPRSALTFRYQWRANGSAIKGATRSSYTVTKRMKGKRITVTVTASRKGYTTRAATSSPTRPVR